MSNVKKWKKMSNIKKIKKNPDKIAKKKHPDKKKTDTLNVIFFKNVKKMSKSQYHYLIL